MSLNSNLGSSGTTQVPASSSQETAKTSSPFSSTPAHYGIQANGGGHLNVSRTLNELLNVTKFTSQTARGRCKLRAHKTLTGASKIGYFM